MGLFLSFQWIGARRALIARGELPNGPKAAHHGDSRVHKPPSNKSQLAAPAYRLAARDSDFLLGDSTRGVRFQLEYQKAEESLRRWDIETTIVVFGSARVTEGDGTGWYDGARAFGRICSERGGAKLDHSGPRKNVIATGGGPGIMEAANRGAWDAGAPNIGFNITLPMEQEPNPYSTPDLTFRFHYFAMRKMHFAMRAAALVVFPGGFGTFDELFEILTLRQTGKMTKPLPIVLYDRKFWRAAVNFEHLATAHLINAADLTLFDFADDAEETWDALLRVGLELPKTELLR
jgi:uncharacterized protein (TIGR00730 family)